MSLDVTEKFPIHNLLLGVTGSVGVLAVPEHIRLLRESMVENVYVMMSYSAKKFVTPYTMRLYSENYVYTDTFDITDDVKVPHIDLPKKCDLFAIMPATANIIGKVANGICDDLISTAVMASKIPVVFIPAMNHNMWTSKANQKNISVLQDLGHHIIPPSEGYEISDMQSSFGSMAEFDVIVNFLKTIINKN